MSLKNLPEISSFQKNQKLFDIFSPDIDTKSKLNLKKILSKESPKINELLSPQKEKEISIENDNEFYSPYVKRTISNVIKLSTNSKLINNNLNFLSTSKKINPKKLYTPSPNIVKSEKLSDRFIPLNKGINLMEKFNLATKFNEDNENINPDKNYGEDNNNESDNRNTLLYNELLKSNVLKENNNSLIYKLNNNCKIDFHKTNQNEIIKTKLFSWKKEFQPKSNFCYELLNNQKENLSNINNNSEFKNKKKNKSKTL